MNCSLIKKSFTINYIEKYHKIYKIKINTFNSMPARRRGVGEGIRIGEIAFLAGFLLAVIAGLAAPYITEQTYIVIALYILGLIVGLLNIKKAEYTPFLVAVLAILASTNIRFGAYGIVGQYVDTILSYVAAFVIPAAIVVALKAIWDLASE